jgi:response regulator of citrate/malate metabolism
MADSGRVRRESRGKWANLTAIKIGKLCGCSTTTAKKLLHALKNSGSEITDETIGRLIHEYRTRKDLRNLKRYLHLN